MLLDVGRGKNGTIFIFYSPCICNEMFVSYLINRNTRRCSSLKSAGTKTSQQRGDHTWNSQIHLILGDISSAVLSDKSTSPTRQCSVVLPRRGGQLPLLSTMTRSSYLDEKWELLKLANRSVNSSNTGISKFIKVENQHWVVTWCYQIELSTTLYYYKSVCGKLGT